MQLHIKAGVSNWDTAIINGYTDKNGELIPFRQGEYWTPIIDINQGQIINWPNMVAKVCYKIRDNGEYWIVDNNQSIIKYPGSYVPSLLDCSIDQSSYGDYIILIIDNKGYIYNWDTSKLNKFYVGE